MRALKTILTILALGVVAHAGEERPLVCAVMDFESDDDSLKDICATATALHQAKLSENPALIVAERSQIAAVLAEQELSLFGKADEARAVRAGRIIGADLLVLGRAMKTGDSIQLVARIVSTSNTRTFGASEDFPPGGDLGKPTASLVWKLSNKAIEKRKDLLDGPPEEEVQANGVIALLKSHENPKTFVVSGDKPDIAAAGLRRVLEKAGIAIATTPDQADLTITGSGGAKTAVRRGQAWFCRAEFSFSITGKDGNTSAQLSSSAGCVATGREAAEKGALEKAGLFAALPAIKLFINPIP
jgi:Curli production assembly/transport component CsgG